MSVLSYIQFSPVFRLEESKAKDTILPPDVNFTLEESILCISCNGAALMYMQLMWTFLNSSLPNILVTKLTLLTHQGECPRGCENLIGRKE